MGSKTDMSNSACRRIPLCITIVAQAVIIIQLYLYSQQNVSVIIANEQSMKSEPQNVHSNPYNVNSKPHIVFGILTAESKRELRDAQRNTWLSTAIQADIPFKFTYKFLIDLPTETTIEENKIHNDIVYLNVTTHGFAVKYGQKIYVWMKYILANYPDAYLGARVDDDVFLCVPQVFEKLDLIKSNKLYYGWAHGQGNKISKLRRVDEMFVVFGRELMERIAKREYCENMTNCNPATQLVEFNWGDESLATWLSIYDDVDFKTDNSHIIHFGRGQLDQYAHNIKPDFCESRFLFHKSTPDVMSRLHEYNRLRQIQTARAVKTVDIAPPNALTGPLFSGAVARELPSKSSYTRILQANKAVRQDNMKPCDTWAVVTTIFSQSKAVRSVVNEPNWCLVVVADTKTPTEAVYLKGIASDKVKFLSVTEQYGLYPLLAGSIPLNNFGRKNIGFVYAIQHGAQAIWDFDDDNIGIIDLKDVNASATFVTACPDFKSNVANPYPYFGTNDNRTWPRGFPLQYIKQTTFQPRICKLQDKPQLGVVQSLANFQPDVDAIYRLTYDIPFNFTAKKDTHFTLVLPKTVYAPFNAQATLWLSPAFKYMALPVSVHGRVSDIWRAYIAQHFMHKDGIQLAFSIPYVTQIRNEHEDIKDFNAELDLYQKSKQLVDFLSSKESDQIQNIVALYEQLYRREYLGQQDLRFIEAWTQTFQHISKV